MSEIEPVYKRIGQELKKMREKREYLQQEVGDALGLTRVSVGNIEAGRQRLMLHQILDLVRHRFLSREQLISVLDESLGRKP